MSYLPAMRERGLNSGSWEKRGEYSMNRGMLLLKASEDGAGSVAALG